MNARMLCTFVLPAAQTYCLRARQLSSCHQASRACTMKRAPAPVVCSTVSTQNASPVLASGPFAV